MTKLDKDTALAKIKVLLGNYYEGLGRGDYDDDYIAEKEVIGDIDEVLEDVDIDMRKVIIEKLELDKKRGA